MPSTVGLVGTRCLTQVGDMTIVGNTLLSERTYASVLPSQEYFLQPLALVLVLYALLDLSDLE